MADRDEPEVPPATRTVSRRVALKWVGSGLAAMALAACDETSGSAEAGDADTTSMGDAADTDASTDAIGDVTDPDVTSPDVTDAVDLQDADVTDTTIRSGWATGGTAAMADKATYPDPFGAIGTPCVLTCATTIGPCHIASPEREDISEGWDGLPVRLALRVVDEDCVPVPDAVVEIWHTNYEGTYSADINPICNDVEAYRSQAFHRGYQRTDSEGVAAFDTCYPGWYPGRVVHIHFRVMIGAYDGNSGAPAEIISQFFWPDALNTEIFDAEPLYSDFGQPDTNLASDGVIQRDSELDDYLFDVAQMTDGAMLASKTIVLRTASDACRL